MIPKFYYFSAILIDYKVAARNHWTTRQNLNKILSLSWWMCFLRGAQHTSRSLFYFSLFPAFPVLCSPLGLFPAPGLGFLRRSRSRESLHRGTPFTALLSKPCTYEICPLSLQDVHKALLNIAGKHREAALARAAEYRFTSCPLTIQQSSLWL